MPTVSTSIPKALGNNNQLLRQTGIIQGINMTILLDCGASCNLVRPGLVSQLVGTQQLQIQRFDGSMTPNTKVNVRQSSIEMNGTKFRDIAFIKCSLPSSHDIIFGQPWFAKYQP